MYSLFLLIASFGILQVMTIPFFFEEAKTTAEICEDNLSVDCWGRLDEECFGVNEPWFRQNCPVRCGFCSGEIPPCVDRLAYCDKFDQFVCKQPDFHRWSVHNCRKHCDLCHPAVNSSAPSVLIKSTKIPPLLTTKGECSDSPEVDCWARRGEDCFGIYEPWARDNCPLRCGFCPGKLPPCEDTIDYCNKFDDDVCNDTEFFEWAIHNCRKHCNLCSVPTRPTSTASLTTASQIVTTGSSSSCHDDPSEACWSKEDAKCFGIYEPSARKLCPLRCGYCPGKPPPCENLIPDCEKYGLATCHNSTYHDWALNICRKYCNLCSVPATAGSGALFTTASQIVDTGSSDSCHDIPSEACWSKEDAKCFGIYEPSARKLCPLRCGFCPGKPPPCENLIPDCEKYGIATCHNSTYHDWSLNICRKYCNLCSVPTRPSTVPPIGK